MAKKIIAYILGSISFTSIIMASGVKEVANWMEITRPFFLVGYLSLALALIIYNIDAIRRVVYPSFICLWAWLHQHKILKSSFSRSSYKVYVHSGRSYSKLYSYVQDAYDQYLKIASEI